MGQRYDFSNLDVFQSTKIVQANSAGTDEMTPFMVFQYTKD